MRLYKVTDYLSQFLSVCNTISEFISVRFDRAVFWPAGYKNKAIVALAIDATY